MIGGFPHHRSDSFFQRAAVRLAREYGPEITTSLFTMGGFPITRVKKHLNQRCLAAKPNIVVLQFASSDLIVPLRGKKHRSRKPSALPATLMDRLKWQLHGWIGDALRLEPVTPAEAYLSTLKQMARTVLEHGATPVVLSPFPFGGRRSDRIARAGVGRLQEALSGLPGAVYLDVYSALNRHPRHRVLLGDGSHLSLEGHQVVTEVLLPRLKELVDEQTAAGKNFAPDINLATSGSTSSS